MRIFGLTGGIATGKSTVAAHLREAHGVPVVDADQVAREVVAPGSDGLNEVVSTFGAEVLDAEGRLDRAKMRARIMADPEARSALERITHPRIFERTAAHLRRLAEAGHPLAVVEAALMVETGSWRMYEGLIVVSCAPTTQRARLMARDGVSAAEAERTLAAQLPMADKEAVATVVIRNDGSLEDLRDATSIAWRALTASEG